MFLLGESTAAQQHSIGDYRAEYFGYLPSQATSCAAQLSSHILSERAQSRSSKTLSQVGRNLAETYG